jgi:hypothetical protein
MLFQGFRARLCTPVDQTTRRWAHEKSGQNAPQNTLEFSLKIGGKRRQTAPSVCTYRSTRPNNTSMGARKKRQKRPQNTLEFSYKIRKIGENGDKRPRRFVLTGAHSQTTRRWVHEKRAKTPPKHMGGTFKSFTLGGSLKHVRDRLLTRPRMALVSSRVFSPRDNP